LQYYAARRLQSTRISIGRLVITARKERLTSLPDYGGQDYTSGRLITRGKKAWTYGYFEIRARLPCGAGAWPAIWMLGLGRPWPDGGEIDIMEQLGRDPPTVYGTIHTRASAGTSGSGSSTTIANPCSAFHTYHLLWTANRLDVGVDGRVYHSYLNDHAGAASWPFNRPQYMLLNLALGGPWAGPPDDTIFPVSFLIDYVRVYQKAP
jgi:beta-glucanase (GH16 family)